MWLVFGDRIEAWKSVYETDAESHQAAVSEVTYKLLHWSRYSTYTINTLYYLHYF